MGRLREKDKTAYEKDGGDGGIELLLFNLYKNLLGDVTDRHGSTHGFWWRFKMKLSAGNI